MAHSPPWLQIQVESWSVPLKCSSMVFRSALLESCWLPPKQKDEQDLQANFIHARLLREPSLWHPGEGAWHDS